MKVVIIGGGAAGINTATRLRRLDENVEIVVLEKSDEFAISTCGLTYYLSGVVKDPEALEGPTVEKMKQRYNIDVRLNHEVLLINRKEKTIRLKEREDETYDKLVLATGALQLRPDIPGILSENIFTIRNILSIARIKDYIKYNYAKEILIVGGGYIGVEAAEALVLTGMKVNIIEASPHIIPGLDEDMAKVVENRVRANGIKLWLNQRVTSFNNDKATLSTGGNINFDLAIIATGVKPDVQIPVLADIEIGENGGIKVNEYMQTNDGDIYAAGDNVELTNLLTGKEQMIPNAMLAVKEARVVAAHIAGERSAMEPVVPASILPFFDYSIGYIGLNEKMLEQQKIKYQKLHIYDYDFSAYLPGSSQMLLKIMFAEDGRILGAQGVGECGVDKRLDIILTLMQKHGTVKDLVENLYCYAPPYSTGKDIINNLGSAAESVLNKQIKFAFYDEVKDNNEVMIIDVRSKEMFDNKHLPNAINIPIEVIRSSLESIPHDKNVVLYCNRGRSAYTAAFILHNRGFDNIYVLSGGAELYWELEKADSAK